MHIILLSRRHGAARSLSLDLRWLTLGLALLIAAAVSGGAAVGAWLAPNAASMPESVEITQALDAQRDEVGAVRVNAQRQLDAFAAHV